MDIFTRWLLTYLLHSTLLLGAMLVVRVVLRDRWLALQEALLRAALVGGFVTASLSLALNIRPLAGSVGLGPAPAPAAAAVSAAVAVDERPLADASDSVAAPAPVAAAPVARPGWSSALRARWPVALAAVWLLLGLIGLTRLSVAAARLRRLLGGRRALADGALTRGARAVGAALGLRSRPRLSAAPRLTVPIATGVLRPEVCLPTRALVELADDEQVALCAHELAHLARRDPAWLLAARLAAILAPVQPLNHWARLRLADLAECLSDDLAVSACARPLGLARSLVDVAAWTLTRPAVLSATAAGAFGARSRLAYRVERLMDPLRRLERPRRFLLPLAAIGVCATALVAPVVSGNDSAAEPSAAPGPIAAPAPAAAPALAPVPAVAPMPAPAPLPRLAAAPARPPLPQAPPAPPKAGHSESEAERRLQHLTQQIEERARLHEKDIAQVIEQINARTAQFTPKQEEIERLSRELSEAASKSVQATAEQRAEIARHMSELQKQITAQARGMKIPREELEALREQARALAKQARPTAEEQAEIKKLSEQIAREALPNREEIERLVRESLPSREELERLVREATAEAQKQVELARSLSRQAAEEIAHARAQAQAAGAHAAEESREQLRRLREQELKHRQEIQGPTGAQTHATGEKPAAATAGGPAHDEETDLQAQ